MTKRPTLPVRRTFRRPIAVSLVLITFLATVLTGTAGPGGVASAAIHRTNGWTTNASTSGGVEAGSSVTLTARVSAATARTGTVRVIVSAPNGGKVFSRQWNGQTFRRGVARTFRTRWSVPMSARAGRYTVKIAIFKPGIGLVHWNGGAAPLAVRATTAQFFEDFRTPAGFFSRFQRQVFHGLNTRSSTIPNWFGDHNHGCEGPTTHRTVRGDGAHHGDLFWWCAPAGPESGHFMTSMYTEGYAQVLFAPNRSFNNVRKVCWDQNLTSLPRKWTQVVIVPEALYQRHRRRLNYVNPELLPAPAIGGLAPGPMSQGEWGNQMPPIYARWDSYLLTFSTGSLAQYSKQGGDSYHSAPPTFDKATRFTQCMTDNGNGTISHVNQLADGTTRRLRLRGSFPDGRVRVIFQDDTYDSFKTDLGDRSKGSNPLATWHWDNIAIF